MPAIRGPAWVRNPIDAFILARLEKEGIDAVAGGRPRRRCSAGVSLDLTGLPPTPAEVDAFLTDDSPDAYEKLVDRLLAVAALRRAAGAGTGSTWPATPTRNGYSIDAPAADLAVPRLGHRRAQRATCRSTSSRSSSSPATCCRTRRTDQKVATGFHRNTLINEEGGIDPEQFRVERRSTASTRPGPSGSA